MNEFKHDKKRCSSQEHVALDEEVEALSLVDREREDSIMSAKIPRSREEVPFVTGF